ncbi:hypothetical protein FEDK69T_19860 [Flavobacterium enshiense DK69]|uniref:Outer membrane protein beta-barrel domain-containing protein n=1 Tax=Flavobacterium enshiense DK69 TaxID=1107311 RepID=V6S7W5_9FLAO|nr:porin family protein [Flavobacterium enshiense]ESU22726.1 hypothetical protein FEDK69T_19860 [Flavobacterium enshiense DK69]KGO95578.1 hypothetical protein Q767_10125 [Flavobacterium enshiense DK69]
MKKTALLACLLLFSCSINGQVLISLLLGDKLNTGKIEFGLDGGVNFASLRGLDDSKASARFNLGFYFDIKMKNDWMFHTGVIVKSTMGAKDLKPYLLNDPELDSEFANGEVRRNLEYFNVPLMMKKKLPKSFYAEGGFQLGLLYKATDEFTAEVKDKKDLKYKLSIKDNYHPLDAGLIVGLGYRLMGGNGMNLGVRYYYGLVDIEIDDHNSGVFNQSIYITAGIPIGAGKAKENLEKKDTENKTTE